MHEHSCAHTYTTDGGTFKSKIKGNKKLQPCHSVLTVRTL